MRIFVTASKRRKMNNYLNLSISQLRKLFPDSSVNDKLSSDLFVSEFNCLPELSDILKYPCRFNGYLAFFCYEGNFEIEINLKKTTIQEGSLFLYTPGNIVRVLSAPDKIEQRVRFIIIAVSAEMLQVTRFDFNKLYDESLSLLENPCVVLNEEERELCKKYYDLIKSISKLNIDNTMESVCSLLSSNFYLMGALWMDRLFKARETHPKNSTRSTKILEEFMKLVRDNHTKERSLSFYADKLYLSPKYLSKLVKQTSGKSAHDWIDSFVILEAKNLLKYSDMSIKSIVYELNFPNQTTFYRFFKNKTGLTPSEYRKL